MGPMILLPLLASLLPQSPEPSQEAEALVRKMMDKLSGGKTLQVSFRIESPPGGRFQGRFEGRILLKQINCARVTLDGELAPKTPLELSLSSDGTRMKMTGTTLQGTVEVETPPNLHDLLSRSFACSGALLTSLSAAQGGENFPGHFNKLLHPSGFRLAGTETIENRKAQIVDYELGSPAQEHHLRIRLWIDAETLLPLRRTIEPPAQQAAEGKYVEVYGNVRVNEEIDDAEFSTNK